MKFTTLNTAENRPTADLLVVPAIKINNKLVWPKAYEKQIAQYETPIKVGDFTAKEGDFVIHYASKGEEPRIAFIGLGDADAITVERLRRSFSLVVKNALRLKAKSINLIVPTIPSFPEEDTLRGVCEGLLLSNYIFDQHKAESIKKDPIKPIETMRLITTFKKAAEIAKKARAICEGVYLARDLVNANADEVDPVHLANFAKKLSKQYPKIKTTIFDKKRLEKEGFGLLLAVGRASHTDPLLIIAEYQGNAKSKEKTVLVGKGVTYDTGGLNLKPTGSMETMRCDMGGAAAVLATLNVVAEIGLKQNITVIVPATENCIGPKSYKPGDVYKSYAGKTVEIGNTDAEGRLILADALAYAVNHLKPTRIVDVATLTGAVEIALGSETTGLFSNQDALADALIRSGSETYERVWRLPIFEEYKEQLRSEIADIKNHGGRSGGSITAALFLQDFVGQTPWAHLDIAATAFYSEAKRYHPRFATGVGVRLLTQFLENL